MSFSPFIKIHICQSEISFSSFTVLIVFSCKSAKVHTLRPHIFLLVFDLYARSCLHPKQRAFASWIIVPRQRSRPQTISRIRLLFPFPLLLSSLLVLPRRFVNAPIYFSRPFIYHLLVIFHIFTSWFVHFSFLFEAIICSANDAATITIMPVANIMILLIFIPVCTFLSASWFCLYFLSSIFVLLHICFRLFKFFHCLPAFCQDLLPIDLLCSHKFLQEW